MDTYNQIESVFPNLLKSGYRHTSPITPKYNCIAWAAGDDSRFWWPDNQGIGYWPSQIPRKETLGAFKELYASLGYVECSASQLEFGFEKIAIYVDDSDVPTHAARQLESGIWASKLGPNIDIEHKALEGLEGVQYGRVAIIMKREKVDESF